MKTLLITLALLFAFPSFMEAQSLNQYRWKSRLVLLFTPSPSDPMFERQVRLLNAQAESLAERKLVVLFITPDDGAENAPQFSPKTEARKHYAKFGVEETQFATVLVGLDGYEKYRATDQITQPSELINMIDAMPMRRQEVRREQKAKSTGGGQDESPIEKK